MPIERRAACACIAASLALLACRSKAPADPAPADAPPASVAERPYALDVPVNLDATKPAPLLLLLHGYGARASNLSPDVWSLAATAKAHGILVARPDGTPNREGRRFWNATDSCCDFGKTGIDDVGYLTSVLDDVAAKHPVDRARVWVLGLSNGGFMAQRLACDRPERFAGIVDLAGAAWKDPARCAQASPVSVLVIHGTDDPLVRYDGGASLYDGSAYPSALASATESAAKDGCTGAAQPTVVGVGFDSSVPQGETRGSRWSGCPKGIDVELWSMVGSVHIPRITQAWSDAVVAWLEAHPKP